MLETLQDIPAKLVEVVLISINPSERLSLYYQLTALLCAVAYFVIVVQRRPAARPGGLLKWLFPRDVLLHPSAVTDYAYFLLVKILKILIYSHVLIGTDISRNLFMGGLGVVFGPPHSGFEPALIWTVLTTIVLVLLLDAVLWFAHYIFHVVPELWAFHKVHHSAEVMTPLTATRMHPVEEIIDVLIASTVLGCGQAIVIYLLGPAAIEEQLFGVNVVVLLFYVAAFNLRHSHVFLRYPQPLQYIFISPAQHQIHHSTRREHWDRNMGFIFAFWDWMAGTLVAPKKHENLTFGLGTAEDGTWRGVDVLMFRPFRQAWNILCARFNRGGARRKS